MKKGLIIAGCIFVLVAWFIGTRNELVSLQQDVEMQTAQVETTLQRRMDLIPNLVSTVKGYAAHEEAIFTEIAEARAKLAGSIKDGSVSGMDEANDALTNSLGKLLAIAENYPTLKANENFMALQDELAGTENRISVARQHYNEKVAIYNTKIQKIPSNIVAQMSGFDICEYYEADEAAKTAPKVDFNKE